jgi:hypothetical protein
MNKSPRFALLAAIFSACIAALSTGARAETLALIGSSTKVCQLTGETDWATNQPTAAQTYSQFGLDGVDLGFPVDSGSGPLYFLFGDAWPTQHPAGSIPSVPPDDALGWTTRTVPPDPTSCLDLQLATSAPQNFAHPRVLPAIKQGSFNVPSGGIFLDGSLYAFFWTDHCAAPQFLTPDAGDPLSLPPPGSTCLEIPAISSIGHSIVARAAPSDPVAFVQTVIPKPALLMVPGMQQMPSGFVYVSAANAAPETLGPDFRLPGIPVFGVARYRASVPYLAMAPRATFGDPQTWSFFAGLMGGNPVWITRAQWESGRNASGDWAPPPGAEIYQPLLPGEHCIGEHSVTWNAPLHAWLLLYNCGLAIEARAAPQPWGPWSAPIVMLSPAHDPGVACTLVMRPALCPPSQRNYWTPKPVPGFFYAPFVLNRYTQDAMPAGQPSRATIYWLVSTWNPYNVVVMQSTLTTTSQTGHIWPIARRPLFIPPGARRVPQPPEATPRP